MSSCKETGKQQLPDVSGIESGLEIYRLEQALGGLSAAQFKIAFAQFKQEKPLLAQFYCTYLNGIPIAMQQLESYPDTLYKYVYQPMADAGMLDTVTQRLNNWDEVTAEIDLAYRLHKYYLGGDSLPPLFTYIAPFGYPIALSEKWLGISVDMFLGSDWKNYEQIEGLNAYQFNRMTPDYLPVACMQGIGSDMIPQLHPNATALDHMIYLGKQLYYLQSVLPEKATHHLIGYTPEQLAYCEQYQNEIWASLITEGLIYSKKAGDIQNVVGEGPFTKGMGPESPARIGHWIGWQIVKAYMDRQEDPSIAALFKESSGQKILESARWKPKRP